MMNRSSRHLLSRRHASGFGLVLSALLAAPGISPCAAEEAPPATSAEQKLGQLSLEELMRLQVTSVTTASKKEETTTAAPGTAIVIDQRDIKLRGYSNLKDVLRDLPGMETVEFFHSEIGTSVPVRGITGNNKIIVLVNGMRVNPPGGEEFPFRSDFSVREAEQIEVIYGPGSTLYGADAISAVINVKTKKPTEGVNGDFGGAGGLNRERETWASFSHVFDADRNISLTGYIQYHDSELTRLDREFPAYWAPFQTVAQGNTNAGPNAGVVPVREDFGLNAFTRFEYGNTSFQIWHRESERSSSEGIRETFAFIPEAAWRDESTVIELRNVAPITEKVSLDSALTYNRYEIDPVSRFVFDLPPATNTLWELNDFKYGMGVSLSLEETIRAELSDKFSLLGGVVASTYDVMPKFTIPGGADPGGFVGRPDGSLVQQAGSFPYTTSAANAAAGIFDQSVPRATRLTYENYGIYAQADWQVLKRLKVIAGSRLDKDTRLEDPSFTPRVAVIYNLTPELTAKYMYSRAYIAPAPYNAYSPAQNAQNLVTTNPGLQPEESENHECNLTYARTNLNLGLSLYYGMQDSLIKSGIRGAQGQPLGTVYVPPPAGSPPGTLSPRNLVQPFNGGKSRNMGLDFYGRTTFGPVSPWFSYSYVDYKEEDIGQPITGLQGVSRHNGRLGLTWAVTDKLFVTPSLVIRSTPENVNPLQLEDELDTPWEINLHVLYAVHDNLEIFADLRNITDHHNALGGSRARDASGRAGAIPQETLGGEIGLRATF